MSKTDKALAFVTVGFLVSCGAAGAVLACIKIVNGITGLLQ